MCLVHNVKKIVEKVLEGAVHLPGEYSKRIEIAIPGYRKKKIDSGWGRSVKSVPGVNKSSRKGVIAFKG